MFQTALDCGQDRNMHGWIIHNIRAGMCFMKSNRFLLISCWLSELFSSVQRPNVLWNMHWSGWAAVCPRVQTEAVHPGNQVSIFPQSDSDYECERTLGQRIDGSSVTFTQWTHLRLFGSSVRGSRQHWWAKQNQTAHSQRCDHEKHIHRGWWVDGGRLTFIKAHLCV